MNNTTSSLKLLKAREKADELGVSERTLVRLRQSGKVKFVQYTSRLIRYYPNSQEA